MVKLAGMMGIDGEDEDDGIDPERDYGDETI